MFINFLVYLFFVIEDIAVKFDKYSGLIENSIPFDNILHIFKKTSIHLMIF